MMTLRVYKVRPDGSRTLVRPKRATQGDEPLYSSAWPPCACPRCRNVKR